MLGVKTFVTSRCSMSAQRALIAEPLAYERFQPGADVHSRPLRIRPSAARIITDQLGHARPSMTQDVYMGRRSRKPEAAAALEGAWADA